MLIAGIVLALVSGLSNSGAALLEKREMLRGVERRRGLALLALLARRPWWLFAMALSAVGWTTETAALGLAPVAVVTTLRSAGRGGLVVAGNRWLAERFGRLELAALTLLTAGGILTAVSAARGPVAAPLSTLDELLVAAGTMLLAVVFNRGSHGLAAGSAVGVLFIATGLFGKEIGDRVVRHGLAAFPALLATPGPWLMIASGVWGVTLLQHALTKANAATLAAITTTISANGLIAAGALLYHQPIARGSAVVPMAIGLVLSTAGAAAVGAGSRTSKPTAAAATRPPAGAEVAAVSSGAHDLQ